MLVVLSAAHSATSATTVSDAVTSKSAMTRMVKKSSVRQPSLEPFAVT